VLPKEPEPGPPLAPKSYEVKGRRDPFVPIALPKPKDTKGGIDVSIFRLVGVIQGPTLLALVEGPDGVGYILKPGDMLGDARLTEVTLTSVVFTVDPLGGQRPASITLRLRTD
jgi:Tfp pilus assembly protein PilP